MCTGLSRMHTELLRIHTERLSMCTGLSRMHTELLRIFLFADFFPSIVPIAQEIAAKIIMAPKKGQFGLSGTFAVMLRSLSNTPIGPRFRQIPLGKG